MTSLQVGILACQGDYEAHKRAFGEIGVASMFVRRASELAGLNALVIPGGESSTLLRFLDRDGLFDALRRFARERPVFGTCAGCILLAAEVRNPAQASLAALDITVERNGYGRQIDSCVLDGPTTLPGGPLEMIFIRAPRIGRTGPGVEVLATREGLPALVRQGRVLAATFHPELTADRRVHRLFVAMIGRTKRPLAAVGTPSGSASSRTPDIEMKPIFGGFDSGPPA